jgi:hypothetical protein
VVDERPSGSVSDGTSGGAAPGALVVRYTLGGMSPKGADGPSGFELVGLGVFLAASVIVPLVGGLSLDAALHTGPLFFFVGLFVGIVAAAGVVYTRLVKPYS